MSHLLPVHTVFYFPKKDLNHITALVDFFVFNNHEIKISLFTVSKAFRKSRNTAPTTPSLSIKVDKEYFPI